MEFFQKLKSLLSKPFPLEESNSEVFKIIVGISVFITLFLYVFRPFDLHNAESDLFLVCFGFGIMTFLASIFYEFVIIRLLGVKNERSNFTFGKWIFYIIGIMFCISLANFLFIRLYFFGDIRWEFFPPMIRGTFIVGIFPTVLLGTLALLRQENKYKVIADQFNKHKINNSVVPEGQIETIFDIPISQIRYIEALQNYVSIVYLNRDGVIKKRTERATLKTILEKTKESSIVKCHRSYLINKSYITLTQGNAQGLLVKLADSPKEIPVSRSFVALFREPQIMK